MSLDKYAEMGFSTEVLHEDCAVLKFKEQELKYFNPQTTTDEILQQWCKIFEEGLNGYSRVAKGS